MSTGAVAFVLVAAFFFAGATVAGLAALAFGVLAALSVALIRRTVVFPDELDLVFAIFSPKLKSLFRNRLSSRIVQQMGVNNKSALGGPRVRDARCSVALYLVVFGRCLARSAIIK